MFPSSSSGSRRPWHILAYWQKLYGTNGRAKNYASERRAEATQCGAAVRACFNWAPECYVQRVEPTRDQHVLKQLRMRAEYRQTDHECQQPPREATSVSQAYGQQP